MDGQEQRWTWPLWHAALTARPWLIALLVLDLLLVGAALGRADARHILPIWTAVAGSVAALVALGQLGVARWQASTAADRHEKQTEADRQSRFIESFIDAVEQLGSDTLQVRLGGIYMLERIAGESETDYWPAMETITAFIRERARWKGDEASINEGTFARFYEKKEEDQLKPVTDIAAALTVLSRRDDVMRQRELLEGWRLDLSSTDLRGANLQGGHFENADLRGVHLVGADLFGTHLERANLRRANLEGAFLGGSRLVGANLRYARLEGADLGDANLWRANLWQAHLTRADLGGANLERANLGETRLEDADLSGARLVKTNLRDAHLEKANLKNANLTGAILHGARLAGADLEGAVGLSQVQLDEASGDATTCIPEEFTRPPKWLVAEGSSAA